MAISKFPLIIPSIGYEKTIEVEVVNTNLVIYGSGFLEPNAGSSHNTGDAFKSIAMARHKINLKNNPQGINKIYYCPTDIEFFQIINDTKNINRLDIYCHGWVHGLNLGGFKGKRSINSEIMDGDKINWNDKDQNKGKDLRRVEIHENVYLNSKESNELEKLNSKSFLTNSKVFFWGCNIGGQLTHKGKHIANNNPLIEDPKKTFAQKFAEKMGKGNIYALVGKGSAGGSMFKKDDKGNNIYSDAEMLPANISYNYKNKNTITLKAINYMKKFPLQ